MDIISEKNVLPKWIRDRILRLHQLFLEYDYHGYDPFDILNAPLFRFLPKSGVIALGINKLGARYVPDAVRKMLRVPMIEDPKIYACAYFGYAFLEEEEFIPHRKKMIQRILRMAKRDACGISWGYQYDWTTRSDGTNRKGTSTIVPASFALFALLNEYVNFHDESLRPELEQALNYYTTIHLRPGKHGKFIGYFSHSKTNVHNANLLGCAAMSLLSNTLDDRRWQSMIAECAATSVQAIDDSGYIAYSDHPTGQWTDCFHHLYVLAALKTIKISNPSIDHTSYESAIQRLRNFYQKNFITPLGDICYFPNSIFPIDCHNYAAAILFHLLFSEDEIDQFSLSDLIEKTDRQTWLHNHRRYAHKVFRNKTDPRFFLRWNQAWMFTALCAFYRSQTKGINLEERKIVTENLNSDSSKLQMLIQ